MKTTMITKARSSKIFGTDFTRDIIELLKLVLRTKSRIGRNNLITLKVLSIERLLLLIFLRAISRRETTTIKKSRQFQGERM